MTGALLLGTQGWHYRSWVGPFYPPNTLPGEMLSVYARAFPSVEVDTTFYALPAEVILQDWRHQVPEGFVLSLKVPQEITHERRLAGVEPMLRRFCDRASALGPALGPLLVQLSPDFRPSEGNRDTLNGFMELLPSQLRWALEFRHPDWLTFGTLDLLGRHNVALVLADARWIKRGTMLDFAVEPTADFSYVRWIGTGRRVTDYSRAQIDRDAELTVWARALETLGSRVKTVFGYFSNRYQGHSPHSVRLLQRLLGQTPVEPEMLQEQVELF